MSNNLFIGIAVGTVMGMCLATKNRQAAQKTHRAVETVKEKLCSCGEELCECMNPQEDMQQNG